MSVLHRIALDGRYVDVVGRVGPEGDDVKLTADGHELLLSPAAARHLAAHLVECADWVDPPEPPDPAALLGGETER